MADNMQTNESNVELKLAEVADMMRQQAEQSGSRLIEGDGMDDFRHEAPRLPTFS